MKKKTLYIVITVSVLLLAAICAVSIAWHNRRTSDKTSNADETGDADDAGRQEESEDAVGGKTSIWIMGDSLAAFSRSNSTEGWGEGLDEYLKSDNVVVRNTAMGGASSSSFVQSSSYKMAMEDLKKGDYVIVQFGINDAWYEDRYTDPFGDSKVPGSFKNVLKNDYVRPILEKGGHVILSTSVMEAAAMFYCEEEQQQVFYTPHVQAVRELVEECKEEGMDVLLLDTYAMTQQLYDEIGMAEAYGLHVEDGVHYNNYGAFYIAGLIAEELKGLDIPCCQDIRTIDEVMAELEF